MKKQLIFSLVLMLGVCGCIRADQLSDPTVVVRNATNDADVFKSAEESMFPRRKSGLQWEGKFGKKERIFNPWRSLGATLLVLASLIGLNLYIKKGRFGRLAGKDGRIKMLERYFIDQKKSLMLMEVEGEKVLLGTGSEGVRKIMQFDGGPFKDALADELQKSGGESK